MPRTCRSSAETEATAAAAACILIPSAAAAPTTTAEGELHLRARGTRPGGPPGDFRNFPRGELNSDHLINIKFIYK